MKKLILKQKFKLKASDVDMWQKLRISVLFHMFQEISIAHTEALGAGRDKTLDKGALWVVTRMDVEINRLPVYDEEIVLKSWPGKMMHVIFPRYYQVETAEGEVLIRASGLWMLINKEKREFIFPEDLGVFIPGTSYENQLPLPEGILADVKAKVCERKVNYSDIDLNGHVNNTKYLDWADDIFDEEFHRKNLLKSLQISFSSEVTPNSVVEIYSQQKDDTVKVKGMSSGVKAFEMICQYDKAI